MKIDGDPTWGLDQKVGNRWPMSTRFRSRYQHRADILARIEGKGRECGKVRERERKREIYKLPYRLRGLLKSEFG